MALLNGLTLKQTGLDPDRLVDPMLPACCKEVIMFSTAAKWIQGHRRQDLLEVTLPVGKFLPHLRRTPSQKCMEGTTPLFLSPVVMMGACVFAEDVIYVLDRYCANICKLCGSERGISIFLDMFLSRMSN